MDVEPRFSEPPAVRVPLADQITFLRRDLDTRERVYPSYVRAGKITAAASHRALDVMRAVLRTLVELAEG